MASGRLGRLAFLIAAFVAAAMSCGREAGTPTGPADGFRLSRAISIQPVFPPVFRAASGTSGLVPFAFVRLVFLHLGGTVALDTVVTFPPGADSVTLALTVPIGANTPATGEPLSLTMDYVNAAGVTVFRGGPVTVNAVPAVAGQPPPPPVQIPIAYTGPGSTAASVKINPKTLTVLTADPFSFTAQALDASGALVPNAPIFFAVLDGPATVSPNGSGTAGSTRGTARIAAQLVTGPTDVATLTVRPRPSALSLVSGNGQTAVVGNALGAPVVVHVAATDGGGVDGVTVAFSTANGGSVGSATATTDVSGNASSTWTLGPTAGPQTLTATATGLAGSPLTVNATATPKPATQLVLTSVPTATPAVTNFGVTVTAQDADGKVVTGFTGTVALALTSGPAGGIMSGLAAVNAIAGVATFSGLQLNLVGTGYVLTATSTPLAPAASGPITVLPGPASKLVFTVGPSGINVSQPIPAVTVAAQDAAGNLATGFTGSITLAIGANPGGGALSGTTSAPAVAGVATFIGLSVTKPGVGYTLTAAATGLAGATSAAFNVTAAGGVVTQLVITVQPSNAVAGVAIAPAIVVQARDAVGALVTSFTGLVGLGIGTNPGGGTLGGVVAVSAVAGVATFNSVFLNKAGIGYTLVATSGALTAATSVAFTITSAAAANIALSAGNGQSALAGVALPAPLAVLVTDAFGNPVSGVTVAWATGGGGSFAPPTSNTIVGAGIAQSSWILGPAAGPQTATATAAGLTGSPVTFTANANLASANKTWTGATSTSWTTATNWAPAAVPAATDSVLIPFTTTQPTLSVSTAVASLYVTGVGASITMASGAVLTVNGTLNANNGGGSAMTGPGSLVLASPVLRSANGTINVPLTVSGSYQLSGPLIVTQNATVSTGGQLTLQGQVMSVGGNFSTAGTGTLTMNNPSDALNVSGNVVFGGGSTTGLLTAGLLSVQGNFSQTGSPSAFDASGTHSVVLNSGAGVQTLSMANPATSRFQSFSAASTGGVTLSNNIVALGNVTTTVVINGAFTIDVGGFLSDPSGKITVSQILLNGSATPISGTPVINSSVTFANAPTTLVAPLTVNGAVSVTGNLAMNAQTVTVNGNFGTTGGGTLTMSTGADALIVQGNATFGGGSEMGQLTAGNLTVTGNFLESGGLGSKAFAAFGVHRVIFGGAATHTITFNDQTVLQGFQNVDVTGPGGATFTTDVFINGTMNIAASVTGNVVGTGHRISVGALTDASGGARWQVDTTQFTLSGTLTTPPTLKGYIQVSANPGQLLTNFTADSLQVFGNLQLNGHRVTVNSNFYTTASGVITMTNPADSLWVSGKATFGGGSTSGLLTKGVLRLGGFGQNGNAASFAADSTHRTQFSTAGPVAISFANPGTGAALSHFGEFRIDTLGGTLTLSSDIFVEGQISSGPAGLPGTVSSADRLITARGANSQSLYLTATRLLLLDGSPVSKMNDARFLSMAPTDIQFEVRRSGTAGTGDFAATLANPVFNTVPTTGFYLKATDTNGLPPFLSITVSGATPATSGAFALPLGGALINWASVFTFNVASGNWNTAANWLPNGVPGPNDDVLIPSGNTANLIATDSVRNLTLVGTGTLAQGANDLYVMGSIVTDPLLGGITCVGSNDFAGITYQPNTNGVTRFVKGRLCRYHSGDRVQANGRLTVSQVFHVHDSTFTFAGNTVQANEAWVATTPTSTGTLVMTNPLDSLIIADSMAVGDPASTSTQISALTAGVISLGGIFHYYGNPGTGYFSAFGTHRVVMTGGNFTLGASIILPDSTASAFQEVTILSGVRQVPVGSVATVRGNLNLKGASAIQKFGATGGRVVVGGLLYGSPASIVTPQNFEFNRPSPNGGDVYSDTGTFSPDTTVYNGGQSQANPIYFRDSLALGSGAGPTHKSVRIGPNGWVLAIPPSGNSNWIVNGKLIVDGGFLRIGNGATLDMRVTDSLVVQNGGTLQMANGQDSLYVAGHALFNGGDETGLLTAGALFLGKNFKQLSGGSAFSFAPSGTFKTVINGGATIDTVTFTTAGSFFQDVDLPAGSTMFLMSNANINGTLTKTGGASAGNISSPIGGTVGLLTVAGLNQNSPYPINFSNVKVRFIDGTTNTTFNNVNFANYGSGFVGSVFEYARTSATPITFTGWNFGSVGFTTNLAGPHFVYNSGTTLIHISANVPSTAVAGIDYIPNNPALITWP